MSGIFICREKVGIRNDLVDKTEYQTSWEEMVGNEIFRQRDKSNNNIGYFHQRIFQYIDKCRVPENGKEGGWDCVAW